MPTYPTRPYPSSLPGNGTTDQQTGLHYITTNLSKLTTPTLETANDRNTQRMAENTRVATEGLVVRDGTLKVGVYPINYTLGGVHKSYAGSAENVLLNATTYSIYLNSSNVLVLGTGGFPADVTTFYRLATVVTSGGDISSNTDERGYNDHIVPQTTSSSASGTNNTSFILDEDNAGAGADQLIRFNRGSTDAEDAAVEWDEANDRFNFHTKHTTKTQSAVNALAYLAAGAAVLDANGAAKVASSVAGNGLNHASGVLSVKTASASGTSIGGSAEVAVDPSDGVTLDANGVAAKLTTNGGLEFDTGSVGSRGIQVNTDDSTIEKDGSGNLRVKAGGLNGTKAAVSSANGALPVIFSATLVGGNTVTIHNADAPYKHRIIDAWSVADSADGGTWKLDDGTNAITNVVTVTGTDKTINRAGTIDDAYYEIASSGTLRAVGDGANADVEIFVMAIRVS